MPFRPDANDLLPVDGVPYRVAEHPAAPGMPYGQEGRAATVYELVAGYDRRALKVFKPRFRVPALVGISKRLAQYAELPGLQVCRRIVLLPQQHAALLREHPDLLYAVVMPWIDGPTWMEVLISQREISREQSLQLGRGLSTVLTGMEQYTLAHCDLSGSNVIVPALANPPVPGPTPVVLVDVEQMYGPGLETPEIVPGGSLGYAHSTAPRGLWEPTADRFSGAVLLSEMLTWCDSRIREAAWGESYFAPDEMQQDSARYRLMMQVLTELWGADVAALLHRAWRSGTLDECAVFSEWLLALPDSIEEAQPVVTPSPAPSAQPSAPQQQDQERDALVRSLMSDASDLEALGKRAAALAVYREALSTAVPGSALTGELALIVEGLSHPEARTQAPEPPPVEQPEQPAQAQPPTASAQEPSLDLATALAEAEAAAAAPPVEQAAPSVSQESAPVGESRAEVEKTTQPALPHVEPVPPAPAPEPQQTHEAVQAQPAPEPPPPQQAPGQAPLYPQQTYPQAQQPPPYYGPPAQVAPWSQGPPPGAQPQYSNYPYPYPPQPQPQPQSQPPLQPQYQPQQPAPQAAPRGQATGPVAGKRRSLSPVWAVGGVLALVIIAALVWYLLTARSATPTNAQGSPTNTAALAGAVGSPTPSDTATAVPVVALAPTNTAAPPAPTDTAVPPTNTAAPPTPTPLAAPSPVLCFGGQACIGGRFYEIWQQLGGKSPDQAGLAGKPLGNALVQDSTLVQRFERYTMVFQPDKQPPNDMELASLGVDNYRKYHAGQDAPPAKAIDGCIFFPETNHNVCEDFYKLWIETGPQLGIKGDPRQVAIALFGLPISEDEFDVPINGQKISVQWFERARFEFHPNNPVGSKYIPANIGTDSAP